MTNTIVPNESPATPQFLADWTMLPYGPPSIPGLRLYDSGQATGSPAGLIVFDRALVSVAQGAYSAGYAEVNMGAPITRIGSTFKLTPGAYGGSICLAAWCWPWESYPYIVPDAPVHVVINTDNWVYQIYDNNIMTTVRSGSFSTPLPTDVPLRAEVRLDRAGGVAYLELPNGEVVNVWGEQRIKTPANFAVFESYQENAATMGKARILMSWADTR